MDEDARREAKGVAEDTKVLQVQVVDWIPIDSLKALTDGFVRGERSIETQRKNEAGRGQGLTTCESSRTQEQAKPGEGKQRTYRDENIDENVWKLLTGTIIFAGRVQQADTRSYPSVGGAIVWNETFEFEGVTGDEELCLHLCNRKKKGKKAYKRIAACGLYLKDVLKARLPLRNRFQMFDPKKGQQAGELGLHLSWKELEMSARGQDGAMDDFIAQRTKQHTTRAWWRLPLYSLFIATSVAVVVSALKKKGKKKKGGNKQHRAS